MEASKTPQELPKMPLCIFSFAFSNLEFSHRFFVFSAIWGGSAYRLGVCQRRSGIRFWGMPGALPGRSWEALNLQFHGGKTLN